MRNAVLSKASSQEQIWAGRLNEIQAASMSPSSPCLTPELRSLLRAASSIWRMRSLHSPYAAAMSCRGRLLPRSCRPNRSLMTLRSRGGSACRAASMKQGLSSWLLRLRGLCQEEHLVWSWTSCRQASRRIWQGCRQYVKASRSHCSLCGTPGPHEQMYGSAACCQRHEARQRRCLQIAERCSLCGCAGPSTTLCSRSMAHPC